MEPEDYDNGGINVVPARLLHGSDLGAGHVDVVVTLRLGKLVVRYIRRIDAALDNDPVAWQDELKSCPFKKVDRDEYCVPTEEPLPMDVSREPM